MPDPTQEHLEALYRPVGELIINWSVFDFQLVVLVAMLYQNEIGKSLERQLPYEFRRRVRFLRKCISKFTELEPYADNMRNMLTLAKQMAMVRDTLVHGAVKSYDARHQRYSFHRTDIDKTEDIHVLQPVKMTITDIELHANTSAKLASFAIEISDHLVKTLP